METAALQCTPRNKEYISPFSHQHTLVVKWQELSLKNTGKTRKLDHWASDKVIKMLKVIHQVRVITRNQIIKTFWPNAQKREIEKKLRKLAGYGALVEHRLQNEKREMVIYTLGPVGFRVINKLYHPNWWLDLDTTTVLKQLIANQFFLRVYRNLNNTDYFNHAEYIPAPHPFTGVVLIGSNDKINEFPLIITRDDAELLAKEIKWQRFEKAIIISESREDILKIIAELKDAENCRFTTDYNLCKVPLQRAFYYWDDEEKCLEEEFIGLFPENA